MVSFVDRIDGRDDQGNRVQKLPVHALSSAFWFMRKGEVNKTQIVNAFSLDAEAEAQLDKIIAFYKGLSADEQLEFRDRFESAGILLETRIIDKAKFISLLGI